MPQYEVLTGTNGSILITDDGSQYVKIEMEYGVDFDSNIPDMPWTVTLNGKKESWKAFTLYSGGFYQTLAELWVGTAQTVTFHLGDTGEPQVGGPLDYSFYVQRGEILSGVRVLVGDQYKRAIPYVNVNGVWKQAETFSRHAGEWKQTS